LRSIHGDPLDSLAWRHSVTPQLRKVIMLRPGLTYAVRLPRCKKKPSVDRHYLTPLFDPKSIVVFAGDPAAEPPCREAAILRKAMAEGSFKGTVTWLDIAMTGTLAELAHSRADLALIACRTTRPWPRWRSWAACAAAPR
jgi:hypothetical protein